MKLVGSRKYAPGGGGAIATFAQTACQNRDAIMLVPVVEQAKKNSRLNCEESQKCSILYHGSKSTLLL